MSNKRKISRSNNNIIIFGVCSGIAEYFNIEPSLVRIIFLLIALLGGIGIIIYLITALLLSKNLNFIELSDKEIEHINKVNRNFLLGIVLIFIGLALNLNFNLIFPYINFSHISENIVISIFLFVIVLFSLLRPGLFFSKNATPKVHKIYRSKNNKIFSGVCGGLAVYFGTNASIIRMIWLILTFATIGVGILIYLILYLLIPKEGIQIEEL